jgi:hypothetical protein
MNNERNINEIDFNNNALQNSKKLGIKQSVGFGLPHSLLHLANEIGLLSTLDDVFGSDSLKILKIAIYFICENNIMSGINDWDGNLYSGLGKYIDDKMCSALFSNLLLEKRLSFLENWIKLQYKNEYVCFDITSIENNSDNISFVEQRYKRHGNNLSQMNLGLFFCQSSHIPIYYNLYEGSINDVSKLKSTLCETMAL